MTSNHEQFSQTLRTFIRAWCRKDGRSVQDALLLQGRKLSFDIARRLREIAPEPGSVTTDRMAAFRRGEGLRIRQSIQQGSISTLAKAPPKNSQRDRRLRKELASLRANGWDTGDALYEMMAKLELRYRERARGFLAFSARFAGQISGLARVVSRQTGETLSTAGLKTDAQGSAFLMTWSAELSKLSAGAVRGLETQKGAAAIDQAFRDRERDMLAYIAQRMEKEWINA